MCARITLAVGQRAACAYAKFYSKLVKNKMLPTSTPSRLCGFTLEQQVHLVVYNSEM